MIVLVISGVIFYRMGKSIRNQVEKTLKEASTEEQEIIRNKLVKAVFPPRFPRD